MTNAVAEIEVSMQQAKQTIAMADALERLHHNADFKQIILEGYFKDEAVRLVHIKGDPNLQDPVKQASIVRDMDAIASLRLFFGTIYQRADWARSAMDAGQEALDEIRNEEMEIAE